MQGGTRRVDGEEVVEAEGKLQADQVDRVEQQWPGCGVARAVEREDPEEVDLEERVEGAHGHVRVRHDSHELDPRHHGLG